MNDFKAYMEKRAGIIDAALDRFLPGSGKKPAELHKAMRYSVFTGGKRIRPVLCLAACEAAGAQYSIAVPPACAIELLHTYTLIHDDLPCMDDDDFRRGKPTSHKVFGEAVAVLAGDSLQAEAFAVSAGTRPLAPYTAADIVRELASAAGSLGVVGGQVADIAATGKKVSPAQITFIHNLKTAALFRAAMRMGAMAGGAGRKALQAITVYAENIGVAFQITDDLIDDVEAAGADDDTSCIGVYGRKKARSKAEWHVNTALKALKTSHIRKSEPLAAIAEQILARKY